MSRPKYKINTKDWLDCLDWLEYQLSLPKWLEQPKHSIHDLGIPALQKLIGQWRAAERPGPHLIAQVQKTLDNSLESEDWARLRKALSAKRRRRKEKRYDTAPVNITLTAEAHKCLQEYKQTSGAETLSEAIILGLSHRLAELKKDQEKNRQEQLLEQVKNIKASKMISAIEQYLELCEQRRSLANSCKIAFQLFSKRPDKASYRMTIERFVEDLIWNESHLGISATDVGWQEPETT